MTKNRTYVTSPDFTEKELGGIIEYHSRCQVQSGNKTYPGLIILLRSHTYGLGINGTVQYVYQILCFLYISYLSYFAFNLSSSFDDEPSRLAPFDRVLYKTECTTDNRVK